MRVEIQLGSTDESHIIRTIEYWDIERRRYPQYEHVAVLVAEDVTSRFLNVIGLFNGFIPIVAIQLQALEVGEALTLVATRVIDLMTLATEEEEVGITVDRAYWEQQRSTPKSLGVVDRMFELIRPVEPGLDLKYNKHYIGLAHDGAPHNFVSFRPQTANVVTKFKIPQSDELTAALEESGLNVMDYERRSGSYRIRLSGIDFEAHGELLADLVRRAHEAS